MPPRHERGSAVIEALVAALIVAATVGAGFETIRGGAERVRGLDARARAMLVAQSQLAGVGAVVPVLPGVTRGVDGAFTWSVEVEHFEDAGSLDLNQVTVRVSDGDGRPPLATLSTLRLAG